jgi:hypothetical protein
MIEFFLRKMLFVSGISFLFKSPVSKVTYAVCSGVRVTRSLVLCACFVDRFLCFCTFSFGHYNVCSSSIYGF